MSSRRTLLISLAAALVASVLVVPVSALPTPGANGEVTEAALGRIFPEPLQTNDYIGYHEARAGLDLLAEQYPDLMEVHLLGKSVGWPTVSGGHQTYDVFLVEVTNEQSEIPFEEKAKVLFMLSIHGNEKGGREGGLRVIEDLVKGIGMGAEKRELGAVEETYSNVLDYMVGIFLFPNPDGWAHEEPEHATAPGTGLVAAASNCQYGTPWYCRSNGNGVDLNREHPTIGWVRERYTPLSEPEARAYIPWIQDRYAGSLNYASDIHGMLNHDNFVATMLPAGSMDPQEMLRSTRAAELLKERLNNNPEYAGWTSLPNDNPVGQVAWGGEFNDWGTVWDAIGYTDSGFSGDWFAQETGLNAPGFDIELAYNHITFDAHYPGAGALMNYFHVEAVRDIVGVFIDSAARDVRVSVETAGTRTAYVVNPYVATSLDDKDAMGGWAAENPDDDLWDYASVAFTAKPSRYFEEMGPYLRSGDAPGQLTASTGPQLSASSLAAFDNVVIPGSAIATIQDDPAKVQAIADWVAGGGNLVLTDSAMEFLELSGIAAPDSVDVHMAYAGYTNFFDHAHPLVEGVRGYARQTYEPVPLGFDITALSAPNWYVDRDAAGIEGLDAVGWISQPAGGNDDDGLPFPLNFVVPDEEPAAPADNWINYGGLKHGEGTIHFLGSLLPDPSEEFYHPYGLDHYATTYTGNALLRNMLGWDQKFAAPPLVAQGGKLVSSEPAPNVTSQDTEPEPAGDATGIPAPGFALAVVGVAAAAAMVMRRRRP